MATSRCAPADRVRSSPSGREHVRAVHRGPLPESILLAPVPAERVTQGRDHLVRVRTFAPPNLAFDGLQYPAQVGDAAFPFEPLEHALACAEAGEVGDQAPLRLLEVRGQAGPV